MWTQIYLLLGNYGEGAKGNAEGLDGHDSQPSEAGERPFPPPGPKRLFQGPVTGSALSSSVRGVGHTLDQVGVGWFHRGPWGRREKTGVGPGFRIF